MTQAATATPTIREKILEELVIDLQSLKQNQPTGTGVYGLPNMYELQFTEVVRHRLGERESQKRFIIGVVDGPERKFPSLGYMDCLFTVDLEFMATLNANENQSEWLNMMLGVIQRKIREDVQLNGNADNVLEVANEVGIDSFDDRKVGGTIQIQVRYKHAEDDPRRRV